MNCRWHSTSEGSSPEGHARFVILRIGKRFGSGVDFEHLAIVSSQSGPVVGERRVRAVRVRVARLHKVCEDLDEMFARLLVAMGVKASDWDPAVFVEDQDCLVRVAGAKVLSQRIPANQ